MGCFVSLETSVFHFFNTTKLSWVFTIDNHPINISPSAYIVHKYANTTQFLGIDRTEYDDNHHSDIKTVINITSRYNPSVTRIGSYVIVVNTSKITVMGNIESVICSYILPYVEFCKIQMLSGDTTENCLRNYSQNNYKVFQERFLSEYEILQGWH